MSNILIVFNAMSETDTVETLHDKTGIPAKEIRKSLTYLLNGGLIEKDSSVPDKYKTKQLELL